MAKNNNDKIRPVNFVSLKMVREKKLGYDIPITCPEEVIALVQSLFQNSYREIVLVVGLDNGNRPTMVHVVSMGSPTETAVSVPCVFKPLFLSNATGFILMHNHPASSLSPSSADKKITDNLKKIGEMLEIPFVDHIILNADANEYYSFKKIGSL
jgi:DNA repair protein RadC